VGFESIPTIAREGAAMKNAFGLAVAGLIAAGGVASVDAQPLDSVIPNTALFIGLGGSYNSMNFGTQNVYAVGTSDVYQNGVLASSGSAAGPANIYIGSESGFAPSVQAGYFQRLSGSDWLWGAKFSYSYLNATAVVRNALLPQAGSFTATGSTTPTPFTGNAVVGSYQTHIKHQMALIPLIGHAFEKGFVYGGAGPTLSQTRTDLNSLVGFADINGDHTDVSGAPVNLFSSSWVYGGAAVIGATYFFGPTWFLDFSYTFAITGNHTNNYASPFTNPNGTNGSTILGTLVGISSGTVTTQSFTISINKALNF
jgi:hypothetical protein